MSTLWRFVRATAVWLIGGTVVWVVVVLVGSPLEGIHLGGGVSTFGVMAVLTTFAGGSALSGVARTKREWLVMVSAAALYGIVAFGVLAYVAPQVDYAGRTPEVQAQRDLLGPNTPSVLEQLRTVAAESELVAALGGEFPESASWYDHRIQFPRVAGVLAVVLALLGFSTGVVTAGLSPPVRRRVRWLIGLVAAFTFMAVDSAVTWHILGNPGSSGVLRSWLTIAPHVLAVLALAPFVRSRLRG